MVGPRGAWLLDDCIHTGMYCSFVSRTSFILRWASHKPEKCKHVNLHRCESFLVSRRCLGKPTSKCLTLHLPSGAMGGWSATGGSCCTHRYYLFASARLHRMKYRCTTQASEGAEDGTSTHKQPREFGLGVPSHPHHGVFM